MQYSRAMMRWHLGLALVALVGCNDKPAATAPAATAQAAPAAPTTAAPPAAVVDLATAAAQSDAAVKPTAPAEAAAPSGGAVKPARHGGHDKNKGPAKSGAAAAQPTEMMPHGSVEDGTMQYNVPPLPPKPAPGAPTTPHKK